MSWLLIDNSNGRTKFALGDHVGIGSRVGTVPTAELTEELLGCLLEKAEFDAALICSVVPGKRAVLEAWLGRRVPVHVLGAGSPIGVAIDYPDPGQIGADRLANAAAVAEVGQFPAIVIDFGTAVTFDVVSGVPAYCGGVIAPGLGAMSDYLSSRTALLPALELVEPRAAIGKSTQEAMQAGAVFGYRGLVREILGQLRAEMSGDPHVVATGGDARLIAAGLPEIREIDDDLTLFGILCVARRVFAEV